MRNFRLDRERLQELAAEYGKTLADREIATFIRRLNASYASHFGVNYGGPLFRSHYFDGNKSYNIAYLKDHRYHYLSILDEGTAHQAPKPFLKRLGANHFS